MAVILVYLVGWFVAAVTLYRMVPDKDETDPVEVMLTMILATVGAVLWPLLMVGLAIRGVSRWIDRNGGKVSP